VYRRVVKIIVSLVMSCFLLWSIVTYTYTAYLAGFDAESALRINPGNLSALQFLSNRAAAVAIVDESFGSSRLDDAGRLGDFAQLPADSTPHLTDQEAHSGDADSQGDANSKLTREEAIKQGRLWSVALLRANPLSAVALVNLGLFASGEGNAAITERLMEAAARRSLRQRIATYWMMRHSFEAGSLPQALTYADSLLRLSQKDIQLVAPILGHVAENEASSQAFIELLKTNPRWRAAFFRQIKGSFTDARTPLSLLLELKESANPPSTGELRSYIDVLMAAKLYDLAYNTWLQFLTVEELKVAGFVFDGGFEFPPKGTPFEWKVAQGKGVTSSTIRIDNDPALKFEFSGARIAPALASQTTMLVPGDYVLSGRYQGQVRARRGLRWIVRCSSKPQTLAEEKIIPLTDTAWQAFELPFTVPKQDCRAQSVELEVEARSASDTMLTGSMSLDTISVRRQSVDPAPSPTLNE